MNKKSEEANSCFQILKTKNPNLKTFLYHESDFQLLIAVILSAQCTDAMVNKVTPDLFKDFPTAEKLAIATQIQVETLIKKINYYKTKSKNIIKTAQSIQSNHHGKVPETLSTLITLPGVGRKTANVIIGQAFNQPGITVDTHLKRVSKRMGWTRQEDPTKIETDLSKIWPKEIWTDFSTLIILHGRETCKARKPLCKICPIEMHCPKKTIKSDHEPPVD